MEQKSESPMQSPPPTEVNFDLEKSPFFRVIHVDGAIGGITPKGMFHIAFFSERSPIPKRMTHELRVRSDGKGFSIGEELQGKRVVRNAEVFREIDVDAMMTIETAKSIAAWMTKRIRQVQPDFDPVHSKED